VHSLGQLNHFESRAAVTKTRYFYLHRRLRGPLTNGGLLSYITQS
jgi:hypothetical protein